MRSWAGLVALGAIAALVKQTFGVFWILLLLTAIIRCKTSPGRQSRMTLWHWQAAGPGEWSDHLDRHGMAAR